MSTIYFVHTLFIYLFIYLLIYLFPEKIQLKSLISGYLSFFWYVSYIPYTHLLDFLLSVIFPRFLPF